MPSAGRAITRSGPITIRMAIQDTVRPMETGGGKTRNSESHSSRVMTRGIDNIAVMGITPTIETADIATALTGGISSAASWVFRKIEQLFPERAKRSSGNAGLMFQRRGDET